MNYTELSDFDNFFYYGDGNIYDEIQMDMMLGIIQPKRSLFYNRQEGCGIPDKENYPNSLVLQVGTRYDIMLFVSNYNTNTETGLNGGKERRVAISQDSIIFDTDQQRGIFNVNVYYLPLINVSKAQRVTIPLAPKGA